MPPRTATEIEHRAADDAGEPEDLLHLFIGDRKGQFRECERIEILPDRRRTIRRGLKPWESKVAGKALPVILALIG
jgi:hypothetical protein